MNNTTSYKGEMVKTGCLGKGNDRLEGDTGNDRLIGGLEWYSAWWRWQWSTDWWSLEMIFCMAVMVMIDWLVVAGDDILHGGDGNDRLIGGAGDDIYIVDNARDIVEKDQIMG